MHAGNWKLLLESTWTWRLSSAVATWWRDPLLNFQMLDLTSYKPMTATNPYYMPRRGPPEKKEPGFQGSLPEGVPYLNFSTHACLWSFLLRVHGASALRNLKRRPSRTTLLAVLRRMNATDNLCLDLSLAFYTAQLNKRVVP